MSRFMPRKRTIFGGVLALGIAAGLYLSDKLPHLGSGFGLGSGGSGLLGKPDTSDVSVQSPSSSKTGDHDESDSTSEQTEKEIGASKVRKPVAADHLPPDDVLTILVEDQHYAVWKKTRGGNGYFPTPLPAVVDLALKMPTNAEGVRVRVVYTKAARYSAWHTLQQELVAAGVPAETIVLTDEVVQ